MPRLFQNLFTLLAASFLVLAALEISYRVHSHFLQNRERMFQYDDQLGWSFIPGRTGPVDVIGGGRPVITTNEAGFRDRPFTGIAAPLKIAVAGDSFVSNVNVPADKVFTEIMEEKIKGASVMNFGVNGYSLVQQYLLLEKMIPKYRPQLVISFIYLANDFFDNTDPEGWEITRRRPHAYWDSEKNSVQIHLPEAKPVSSLPVTQAQTLKLEIFDFILEKIRSMRFRMKHASPAGERPWDFEDMEVLNQKAAEPVPSQYKIMKGMIEKINALGRRFNVPVLFVLAPSTFQVSEAGWQEFLMKQSSPSDYNLLQPNESLKNFMRSSGMEALDLYPRMRSEFLKGARPYNPEELHWNAEGNRIAAEEILRFIGNNPRLRFSPFLKNQR